jgi:signal transduction histidine kinase
VQCRREATEALVSITDTGRGIAPAALATLFQSFHQVDRDERAGGLGLGLAITRGIIDLHGGRITAESPGLGCGSTFTIALPLRH